MPDAPFLPPGPSPEFLRRQALAYEQQQLINDELRQQRLGVATAGSFDPSTGESQSMSGVYPVVPPPSHAMRMLEARRQQMNNRKYATEAAAQAAADHFMALRAAQQMRESGETDAQIMGTLGMSLFPGNKNPYLHSRAVTELEPVPEATVRKIGGHDILISGRKGERAQHIRPQSQGETIETGVDATGQPFSRITRGGKPAGGLTTATQGQVQQRLLGFEKTMGTASQLLNTLTPEMVGVKGLLGDVVVDNVLAQQFPELANSKRVNGRTLLRVFNESIIKSLKVDAQVNRDEEKRLLAALPDAGATTSLPAAQEKIKTFMEQIRDQTRIDANASGAPVPKWALTLEDLAKQVKSNQMTKAEAVALMKRYSIRK